MTRADPSAHDGKPVPERDITARTCWAISDGTAGNERQALALASALDLEPRVLRIRLRQPWDALAPRLVSGAHWAIHDNDGSRLNPPWPDIAIGCGRRAALLLRALRRWSDGRCFCVQILDPRIAPAGFDVVIAPAHDRLHGDNVITSVGALNPVDDTWLAEGRRRFPDIGNLPSPRCTVLIGANHRVQSLDREYVDALVLRLERRFAETGGSFLVSTSRRTPADLAAHLRERFARHPGVFWANSNDGENPYQGLLGWANSVLITPDSVNMLSEACATGKPVFTFAPKPLDGKLARFHALLRERGHVHGLDDPRDSSLALNETAAIAAQIRERWREHLGN